MHEQRRIRNLLEHRTEGQLPLDQYDVSYEGPADNLTNYATPTVYTVTTKETTFVLTKTIETTLCGYKLMLTERPKLFILETERGKTFNICAKISVNAWIFSLMLTPSLFT